MKNEYTKKTIAIIILSILAVSCSEQAPPSDGMTEIKKNDAPITQVEEAMVSEPVSAPPSSHETEFATFSVEPGHVSACAGKDRVISKVSWNVRAQDVVTVKVLLSSEEDKAFKLFTMGGATGAADTENWVGAGVKFHLVDAKTEKELATHEVTMLPCLE